MFSIINKTKGRVSRYCKTKEKNVPKKEKMSPGKEEMRRDILLSLVSGVYCLCLPLEIIMIIDETNQLVTNKRTQFLCQANP